MRQYEHTYVRAKLKELVARVESLDKSRNSRADLRGEGFDLREEDFIKAMNDDHVRLLLKDLDVASDNPAGLFDTFDLNRRRMTVLLRYWRCASWSPRSTTCMPS